MLKQVFISHSSKDHSRAVEICEELEKNGISCWIAPRNAIGGMPYAEEIVHAIRECKVVLLIASFFINSSEQIMNEIEIAVNNSKIILPFKIEEVEYNDSYKYYLNRKHWIEATPNPQNYYSLLVEELKYLLSSERIDTNTIDNTYLNTLKERNRQKIISNTREIRLSFGLSINNDDYSDKVHTYVYIKRIDALDDLGSYSSLRWLTVRNVSSKPTHYIIHKECGENKVNFDDMRVRAKQLFDDGTSTRLLVDSMTPIQPNFIQVFKVHFIKPLEPGCSARIYYRLNWPNEQHAMYQNELSQSISLTRYSQGVDRLVFGLMCMASVYDFSLQSVDPNFDSLTHVALSPQILKAEDDAELKPIHGKNYQGIYYNINNASQASAYRILYKKAVHPADNNDEEDF